MLKIYYRSYWSLIFFFNYFLTWPLVIRFYLHGRGPPSHIYLTQYVVASPLDWWIMREAHSGFLFTFVVFFDDFLLNQQVSKTSNLSLALAFLLDNLFRVDIIYILLWWAHLFKIITKNASKWIILAVTISRRHRWLHLYFHRFDLLLARQRLWMHVIFIL